MSRSSSCSWTEKKPSRSGQTQTVSTALEISQKFWNRHTGILETSVSFKELFLNLILFDHSYNNINGNHLDRMDMFVLLDLIGTTDTQFISLKRSTQKAYDRLIRIENVLRRQGAIEGPTIFSSRSNYFNGVQDDHLPFEQRSE